MFEEAGTRQRWRRLPEAGGMTRQHLLPQVGKGRATNRRRRPGKTGIDDCRMEADDLEDLRALVAVDGRNAHLGEDFQRPVFDGLHKALLGRRRGKGRDRLQGQAWTDRLGSEAKQRNDMMDVARFVGLDDQAGPAAQAGPHQVVMHAADGE